MIEELCIRNFKSFGPDMAPLKLGPLNFVVGANASGKTNLLSALRFLKTAMRQNIEVAANEYGGTTEIKNNVMRRTTAGRERSGLLEISLSIRPRPDPFSSPTTNALTEQASTVTGYASTCARRTCHPWSSRSIWKRSLFFRVPTTPPFSS